MTIKARCGNCRAADNWSDGGICFACGAVRSGPPPRESVRLSPEGVRLLVVVVVVAVAIWGGLAVRSSSKKDPVGFQVCADYYDLATDSAAGVVSGEEFQARAQRLYGDADMARSVALRDATGRLASGALSGEMDESVASEMVAACRAIPEP